MTWGEMLADSFLCAGVLIYVTSAISWGSVKCRYYSYLMEEESRVGSPLSVGLIPTQLLLFLNHMPGVLH